MSRTAVPFILLAALGGCAGMESDPTENPWKPPPSGKYTQTSWAPQSRGAGAYADGALAMRSGGGYSRVAQRQRPADGDDDDQPIVQTAGRTAARAPRPPASEDDASATLEKSTMVVVGAKPAREAKPEPAAKPRPKPAAREADEGREDCEAEGGCHKCGSRPARGDAPAPCGDGLSVTTPRAFPVKGVTPEADAMPAATPVQAAAPASPAATTTAVGALRLVNGKRITFSYEVKEPSPSPGAVSVEVWGTRDMRNWKKYEAVDLRNWRKSDGLGDTPAKYLIEVEEEGLFGFTMRPASTSDKDRPVVGELPQVWVAVDMTPPSVQLLGTELNTLTQTPTLTVRWSAQDKNLSARPITLSYAEKPDGPWTPCAAGLANTSRYEWVLPPGLPRSLYMRVQADDLMGNVGTAQTPSPLHLSAPATVSAAPRDIERVTLTPAPGTSSLPAAQPIDLPQRPLPVCEPCKPAVVILSVEATR
jgi:hypothetical protein